ncbi:MAG: sulfotransferase [Phycisphaerales bacterium]
MTAPDFLARIESLRKAGRIDEAIAACIGRGASALPPAVASTCGVMLLRRNGSGDAERAAEMLRRGATSGAPGPAVNLAVALRRIGRCDEAISVLRRVTEAHPGYAAAWFNLGNALRDAEDAADAQVAYERAIALQPGHVGALRNLGNLHFDERAYDAAREAFERWRAAAPEDVEAIVALARLSERTRDVESARRLAVEALGREAACASAMLVLAKCDRAAGELEDAEGCLRSALDVAADQAIRGSVLVELGHVLDRSGRYVEALDAYARGQADLRQSNPGAAARAERDRAALRNVRIPSAWIDGWPTAPPDDGQPPPVFIVGFPRSGTTLVEQILAAHPGAATSDELPLLNEAMSRLARERGMSIAWPEVLQRFEEPDVVRFRAHYREVAAARLGVNVEAVRIVDKQPFNLQYAALIRRVYPEARLIVVLRDPRDAVLSAWFQDFRPRSAGHFYDLATAVDCYDAQMSAWLDLRPRLGGAMLEVRYESLVEDVEAGARRIIAFAGLQWHDRILEFPALARRRAISTPSYQDVSTGVHTRARERWRRYESAVRPYEPRLRRFLDAFGYV